MKMYKEKEREDYSLLGLIKDFNDHNLWRELCKRLPDDADLGRQVREMFKKEGCVSFCSCDDSGNRWKGNIKDVKPFEPDTEPPSHECDICGQHFIEHDK